MSNSLALYDTLFAAVRKVHPNEDPRRQRVFTWLVVGLLLEKTISLSVLALAIVSPAFAASRVRRLRRFLANPRVCVRAYYDGLIREALAGWRDVRFCLMLDTTTLAGRLVVLRVSLAYRGRAIPLCWQVYEQKSVSLPFRAYKEVLRHTRTLLPADAEVVLLGDRGFRTVQLMRWCRKKTIAWHFRLRLKGDQFVLLADGRTVRLDQLGLRCGMKGFLHGVLLGRAGDGPIHLALAWAEGNDTSPWFIASDEPTDEETLGEYALRAEIEHEFLDDKSGGFQFEASQLEDAASVSRLLLVMSVADLYVVSLGTLVVEQGMRHDVDTHWTRGLSYFQIGWRLLRRVLHLGGCVRAVFRLGGGYDPAPVTLSRSRRKQPVWSAWSWDLILA